MKKQEWSLPILLKSLHDDVERKLCTVRECMAHPGTKGDASEDAWMELFKTYLPKRYEVEKAHIVDSKGRFSEQIDVVIFDRQYSPLIFHYQDKTIIPAESVYAVFEAKQAINAEQVKYAKQKIASVRRLGRTNLPVPHAGGTFLKPRPLLPIYGGLLTLETDWKVPMTTSLIKALNNRVTPRNVLDMGCIAAHGYFLKDANEKGCYNIVHGSKPATAFLFKLITMLQSRATVPMIDIEAYAKWL
jgi:hypothetical protein